MKVKKVTISKKIETSKTFSYQLPGVVLSFTLNVDNFDQLEAYKVLLDEAQKDVQEILESRE